MPRTSNSRSPRYLLMDDAEILADVTAFDASTARIDRGEDEVIPLEIIERRLAARAQ